MNISDFQPFRSGCQPQCRGCSHRGLSLAQSEAQKIGWLSRILASWSGQLASLHHAPVAQRWHYRDRVSLHTRWQDGRWWAGMMHRDEFTPFARCPAQSDRLNDTLELLLGILPGPDHFPLAYYVQASAQVVLVIKSHAWPETQWLDDTLLKQLSALRVDGLWLNRHPSAGRHLFSKRGWSLLAGKAFSESDQGLRYGPAAFQQLIPALYQYSLDSARQFLMPRQGSSVLDLYCGIGATLRLWTEAGAHVLGVESGREAVECARHNAPEAEVLLGMCRERIPQMRRWCEVQTGERLLYVNPPRTGLEPEVSQWVALEYRPNRIAYLSCSAGTLKRDLIQLCANGYHVVSITPYDFFPQTHHVETLTFLELA